MKKFLDFCPTFELLVCTKYPSKFVINVKSESRPLAVVKNQVILKDNFGLQSARYYANFPNSLSTNRSEICDIKINSKISRIYKGSSEE